MTTPAVNETINVTSTGSRRFIDTLAGVVTNTTPATVVLAKGQLRPASSNSPRSSSGWRNPTVWSHKRYSHNPVSGGNLGQRFDYHDVGHHYAQYDSTDSDYGLTSNSTYPSGVPSWMLQVANTRAYTALKGQQVNLSVAFAEREETKQLFEDGINTIVKGVRSYKSRNPKKWGQVVSNGFRNEFRNIPQDWLELQYGWNPLMQDIQGSCNALSKRERDNDAYYAYITGKCNAGETKNHAVHDTGYLPSGVNQMVSDDIYDYHVVTRLWYDLDNPVLASFASLGLTNPLEVIWERVPYSFVVDWFLPVGNWLSTLDADFGWTFKAGCQSSMTKLKRVGIAHANRDTSSTHYWNGVRNYQYDGIFFLRTMASTPPGVGLPHFKNPLSAHHLANALSLLTNVFRR